MNSHQRRKRRRMVRRFYTTINFHRVNELLVDKFGSAGELVPQYNFFVPPEPSFSNGEASDIAREFAG